jgi:DNA-binding transcriptional MerR regulator
MRIGTLAQATGLSRDTLRFYERQGLLKARRRANGYRDYPPEAVEWLGYIRTAQRLGFSLQEIAANLEDVERAADPDAYLQELLRDKLRVIEARIDELQALRRVLYSRLGEACPLRGWQIAADATAPRGWVITADRDRVGDVEDDPPLG